MRSLFFTLLLFVFGLGLGQDLVFVQFKDKPSAQQYFDNPQLMLTQKALDRRAKYGIALNLQDVPVETNYITQIENLLIEPVQTSKWFNGIFAWCTNAQVAQLENLSFVLEVKSLVQNENATIQQSKTDKFVEDFESVSDTDGTMDYTYGYTHNQVTQLNLDYLHNLGFTGEGISIAILDNGFPGVNTAAGFQYMRDNGQIKDVYNFLHQNENVYAHGTHGTVVLSTIGGYIANQFVGTAIDADFYLYVTENPAHELPDEEANWIAAAELADYHGVDVINTSLGYNDFDDPRYDYSYSDMNGETTYISRGAQIAAEKGIMVVVSAGNSGNDDWHYITAPADAKDVLTIGAVDENGNPAWFSSFGPSADGRIKPDVDAKGVATAVIRPNGNIEYSNGTSFSSPIMAGAMACLIQAFPNLAPDYLREKVRQSAHLYNFPTDQMGYGIPNFENVHEACLGVLDFDKTYVRIVPNPTPGFLNILSDMPIEKMELMNVTGQIVQTFGAAKSIDISIFPKGLYLLKVQLQNGQVEIKKVIKK